VRIFTTLHTEIREGSTKVRRERQPATKRLTKSPETAGQFVTRHRTSRSPRYHRALRVEDVLEGPYEDSNTTRNQKTR
jgi:hypothetical protein